MTIINNQKGMGAIFTVIIISAAALIMAQSVSLLGRGELELGQLNNVNGELLYLTEGCVNEAMRRIQLDDSFIVSEKSLAINGKYCIINTSKSGNDWTIVARGEIDNYKKIITINAQYIDGIFSIDSWE